MKMKMYFAAKMFVCVCFFFFMEICLRIFGDNMGCPDFISLSDLHCIGKHYMAMNLR